MTRVALLTVAALFVGALVATPVHLLVEVHDYDHTHEDGDHSALDHASPDVVLAPAQSTFDADFETCESCEGTTDVIAVRATRSVESPPPRPPSTIAASPRAPPAA